MQSTKKLFIREIHRRFLSTKSDSRDTGVLTDFHEIPLSDDQISHRTRLSRLSKELLESKKVGIRSFSRYGFRLIDGTFLLGPIAVFPKAVLSWRVPSPAHITQESLEFFTLLEPKIDVLILGVGDRKDVDSVRRQVVPFLKNYRIGFEAMETEEAISTFNFLNAEDRCVAGALYPPADLMVTAAEHGRAMAFLKPYDEVDINPFTGGLSTTFDSTKDFIKSLWGAEALKTVEDFKEQSKLSSASDSKNGRKKSIEDNLRCQTACGFATRVDSGFDVKFHRLQIYTKMYKLSVLNHFKMKALLVQATDIYDFMDVKLPLFNQVESSSHMKFSILNARRAAETGDYGQSLLNYLTVLRTVSDSERQIYFEEFRRALQNFARDEGDFCKDRKSVFELSQEIFPNNPDVLALSAQFFFASGDLLDALRFAKKSLLYCKTDIQYVRALVDAENIKSNVFDQWHWAMLNDNSRNVLYSKAIGLALETKRESRVLDVGGGTALLSILASRYSKQIYCCEMSRSMCSVARKTTEGKDEIRVIEKHSTYLDLQDLDSQKVDVIITETMDSGLFGEGIVVSLLDAQRRLAQTNPLVIPHKAMMFASLIECEQIFVEHVANINGSRFLSRFVNATYGDAKEPYWCCYVDEVKGGYNKLTESVAVTEILFNNISQLEATLDGTSFTSVTKVDRKGQAHAIMVWFQCELFPGVQLISTTPEASSCWQQAIFPLELPVCVEVGETIEFIGSVYRDQLHCEISSQRNNTSKHFYSKSLANSNDFASKETNLPNTSTSISFVKESTISKSNDISGPVLLKTTDFLYLNDGYLADFFVSCLIDLFQLSLKVVDLTNIATISLKLERSFRYYYSVCFYHNCDYKTIMGKCCDKNKSIVLSCECSEFPCQADVILFWPLLSSGSFCEVSLNQMVDMKLINPKATVIPSVITIVACLISCPKVVKRSKPLPEAYAGVDLTVIEDLAISYYYDVEPSTLQHEKFSESFELLSVRFDSEFLLSSSDLPTCLQQIRSASKVAVSQDGVINGILFWHDASFKSHHYSSVSANTNARCAIYLFDKSRNVAVGEELSFKTSLYHGNMVVEEVM